MSVQSSKSMRRREFVKMVAGGTTLGGLALATGRSSAAEKKATNSAGKSGSKLEAGEGVVDITPPLGIEMAGFHRPPGNERRIKGIRQKSEARAIVIRRGQNEAVLLSLDITGVSREMAQRIQKRIAEKTGIDAANVRICATHTHSMPTCCFYLQWGAISPEYMALVEKRSVEAAVLAKADLAEAELLLGKSRSVGGNFNRTTKNFKTDEHFGKDSTDAERWLDTMVHVLRFARGGSKKDLLWYHFSAHPVCYTDDLAGPDWPGLMANMVREKYKISPSYLQGHCGDVNPGDGKIWIGKTEPTAEAVFAAFTRAMDRMKTVKVDEFRVTTGDFGMPLDVELFGHWLEKYRKEPDKCNSGVWVDSRFAKAWYEHSIKQDVKRKQLPLAMSAMRLGSLGLVFHPAELYSYYGLAIQRDAPTPNTLVVGYADDSVGYAADPNAYKAGEYAAITVPKILLLPPYLPTAARDMSSHAVELMKKII
ncbi:MAG: neutral/alkaline non-lysosomal ceramidase N-terminal domain-containing protein [Pirellulales bacterium]|nr:neutral/alkaline non-lysosomal ceramidase N-terminal domain-containing protein [Pirellulales bacterium]